MPEEKQETALAVQPHPAIAEVIKQAPQSAKVTRLASFTPANLTEAIALAKLMARSELVPKEYRGKPDNCLIGMQYAAELGIPPLSGLQNISIINGRASVWGDLFLALIQSSPMYEWHKEYFEGSGDAYGAVCVMKRKGQEPHAVKFTVQMAKVAKLWGKRGYNGQDTPWITNPDRMLQMRARGFAGRDKFSDALKGLIIAEEAMDLPIDTSDAKKARESATLDVGSSIAALAPSVEPNRGHNDTGLQRSDEQTQAPAKDNVMCSECRVINGHTAECEQGKKDAVTQQDAKTSKPTTKALYFINGAETRTKKKSNEPYVVLNATPEGGKAGNLYVWHKSFHPILLEGVGKDLLCEVSTQKQGNSTYVAVEHILQLGDTPFVNDAPAQQGQMPVQEREPGEDDEDF